MRLFSKRNRAIPIERAEIRFHPRYSRRPNELISSEVRNRIISEIRFLTSSDDYLEFFILFDDEPKDKKYFDTNKIDIFSLSELGYKMSSFFEFEDFAIVRQEIVTVESKTIMYFDDYKLFDLAEIVILFSKKDKRLDVINRFNSIFTEEDAEFQIIENLITKKSGDTIKTLVSLLKDENLKRKINSFYELLDEGEYTNSSKISADILNIIFSGILKDEKPQVIKQINEKVAKKIVIAKTNKNDKSEQLIKYLDSLLSCAKNLNNNIYDIRHTEKSTVEVSNENVFKLISNLNMSIVELVLTSIKDDFILGEDWEKIKNNYIDKYNIDRKTRLAIKKPEKRDSDEINIEDIPF